MVDVRGKAVSHRTATASGIVRMLSETAELIESGTASKGDVLGTARLAGIMASKQVSQLIPLCHSISIDSVAIEFSMAAVAGKVAELRVDATVGSTGVTGVEMEALTAVSIAALTVYDMCKSVDRSMEIREIRLMSKTGGASGNFERSSENEGNSR